MKKFYFRTDKSAEHRRNNKFISMSHMHTKFNFEKIHRTTGSKYDKPCIHDWFSLAGGRGVPREKISRRNYGFVEKWRRLNGVYTAGGRENEGW